MKDWLDIIKELTKKLTLSLTFAALMVLVGIFLREQIRRNGESSLFSLLSWGWWGM